MARISAVLTWLKNPYQVLKELKRSLQTKILKKAVRAGVKLVQPAIKSAVPKRTGALRVSIGNKVGGSGLNAYAIIGAKTKYKKGNQYPALYLSWLEFGTKKRVTKKSQANRGQILPRGILQRAFSPLKKRYIEVAAGIVGEGVSSATK